MTVQDDKYYLNCYKENAVNAVFNGDQGRLLKEILFGPNLQN